MRASQLIVLLPLLLIGSLFVFSGCEEDSISPPDIVLPGDNEDVVFSKHIAPILTNSCNEANCHGNGSRSAELSLESWESLVQGSEFGAVVVPYSAEKSHLFQHINTDPALGPRATPRMPLSRDALPIEQIRAIKRWVDEGAKNDDGEIPLAGANRSRVFVTCQSEDLVAAIDLSTEYVMRYIGTGVRSGSPEAPHNIALSPDGAFFYINHIASGTVEKYDVNTFVKLGEVEVGLSPAQIVITKDGSTLYVSNFDLTFQERIIHRVNTASMTVTATIDVSGLAPHGVTLSEDERYLYTMNAGTDDISIIDLATRDVDGRIPMVPGSPPAPAGSATYEPYQSLIASNGLMYVTCRGGGEVRVVDLNERKVVDSIQVGSRPLIPAITPDGRELWVPNQGSNTVSIINISSGNVTETISGLLSQPHAIAFANDGRAFVTCENQTGGENLHHPLEGSDVVPGIVYVINTTTRTITRPIEVAGFAAGIIISD